MNVTMNTQCLDDQTLLEDLTQQANQKKQQHLTGLFAENPQRFEQHSIQFDQLTFDYSKHLIDQDIMQNLYDFADQKKLNEWIARLFSTEAINYTEHRAAMHWALRLPKHDSKHVELSAKVHEQLDRMYQLVDQIHAGQYRGCTGEVIQDVVNIGVGGSDLGPLMVTHALSDFKVSTAKPLNVHFVSTMDGSQLSELLHQLRPETTLFIISSKSFGTIDTLSNAQTVRQWLDKSLGNDTCVVKHHFIGVSTKPDKMTEWGIAPQNQFLLWDWVGGVIRFGRALAYPLH